MGQPLDRDQTIELILKMLKFNQREQAMTTYKRENARRPKWQLFDAIREAMMAAA